LSAADGTRIASTPLQGRAVASADRVVLGPQMLTPGGSLVGLDPSSFAPRWTQSLSGADLFLTPEIRLARWQPKPDDLPGRVALAFAQRSGRQSLSASGVSDGTRVWSGRVPSRGFRGIPALFELVPGKLGVMSGAQPCGQCDPPYAHSNAAFSVLDVPTL